LVVLVVWIILALIDLIVAIVHSTIAWLLSILRLQLLISILISLKIEFFDL
jgi:hypothetical protein